MAGLPQPTSQSRSLHERIEQDPLNYSESQAVASSMNDSHHRYRKRDRRAIQEPQGVLNGPVTDLSFSTEDASLYSYHSARDLSRFIKEVDGRPSYTCCRAASISTQALAEVPLRYFIDDGEFQRLDKQHYAFVLGQGGLYPSECRDYVQNLLSSRDGDRQRAILDIGCGSGIWTVEIAREFPQCDVLGLDLAPTPVDIATSPPNCRFEIDDINLGLSHYHGQFSLIHVRCIGSGLSDHAKIMRDIEACLTPGGIVFFIDGDMTVFQEDMVTPIPVGQETDEGGDPQAGSWLHRMMRELRYAAVYNGCDVNGLETYIDEGIWDHELIDPSTVRVASLCTPVGTWGCARDPDTQQRLMYVGSLLRQNLMLANRGYHPMLNKHGIPQETLNRWSERVDEELTAEKFRMCLRWRLTWGVRRATSTDDDAPAVVVSTPPLPDAAQDGTRETETATIPDRTSSDFTFMEVWDTKEDAAAVMAIRRTKAHDLPVPMVVSIRTPHT